MARGQAHPDRAACRKEYEGRIGDLAATGKLVGLDGDPLTDAHGRVASDEDFVFYNQPSAAEGAARLLGKQKDGTRTVERAAVHFAALPERVQRMTIAINMDADTGLTCGSLTHAELSLRRTAAAWAFQPPADPAIRAMVVAELYRHRSTEGLPVWKLRAVGQGWADGLDGLAGAHGVDVVQPIARTLH
ncbi:TerD family protein [Streptomyces vietnamensis]|uniref:TerD family protein n=1 Tax=Streptomyces vietnamensis TaxID=362257 RepID=UPI003794FFAD